VQPPAADWGIMASDGRDVLLSAPWVSLTPGATIVIVAVALNFAGDGLRDALDPRLRTRR
jgi:peptide/nickel transport system permease protein